MKKKSSCVISFALTKTKIRFYSLILVASFLTSCTQTYKVDLNPELYVNPSAIGQNRVVDLKVEDMRRHKYIGKGRGDWAKFNKFKILATSNVAEALEEKIVDGLKEMQFRPKTFRGKNKRSLHVEILTLKDRYLNKITNLGKFDEIIKVAIRATCSTPANKYRKIYKIHKKESHKILGGNFPNEKLINRTLSLVLQNMIEDK